MQDNNYNKDQVSTEVRTVTTEAPIDEAGVLQILELMIMPRLKAPTKKQLNTANKKPMLNSVQKELKSKENPEIHSLSKLDFKESA